MDNVETGSERKIQALRDRIAEHQSVIMALEQKQAALRIAPMIPNGASGEEIATIFERASGRDDEILGNQTALGELNRRLSVLQSQLAALQREDQQRQEQEHRARISQDVLSSIGN